jgi:hypothetical protein
MDAVHAASHGTVRVEAFHAMLPSFSPIEAFMVIRRGTKTAKSVIIRQQAESCDAGTGRPISAGPGRRCAGETRS